MGGRPSHLIFREYYLRGSKKALPNYKFPEPKPSPEKQRELRAAEARFIEMLKAHSNQHLKQIT